MTDISGEIKLASGMDVWQNNTMEQAVIYSLDTVLDCIKRGHDNTSSEESFFVRLHEVAIPVIFSILTFFGVLGNSLTIYITLSFRNMRTTINYFMLNLAFADLCFLVFCVPMTAYHYATRTWHLGYWACRLWSYPMFVALYVNMYTLVLISVYRYVSVTKGGRLASGCCVPFLESNTAGVLFFTWLVMIFANIPAAFMHDLKETQEKCEENYIYCGLHDLEYARIIYLLFLIFGYIIPLFLMVALYTALWRYVQRRSIRSSDLGNRKSPARLGRLTKLILLVIVSFCVCWLPLHLHIIIVFQTYLPESRINEILSSSSYHIFRFVSLCLAYLNCCVNPLIYHFVCSDFRKAFKRAFCRKNECNNCRHAQSVRTTEI